MNFPDRLFDTVIVRPPSTTFNKCVSGNPLKATIDINLARRQHEEYIKILLENGVEVIKLKPIDQFPDSVFIQDTALVGLKSRRGLIARFGEVSRRGEEEDIATFLSGRRFEVFKVEAPGTIEGGDLMVTDLGIIYAGLSRRTNIEGIKQLMKIFPKELVVAIPIEKTFHLLGGVNYIGNKTIIIAPSLVDLKYFEGFKMIIVPEEEEYASNSLYIGNGKIMVPIGYEKTIEKLRREGFKPIEVDISEFWKCDGGVTCLSLPMYKTI